MLDGRKRLDAVDKPKDLYTDRDIRGLGKNFMLEASRVKAVETYTFYIRYYALMGLMNCVEKVTKTALKGILGRKTKDKRWEHERKVLLSEFGKNAKLAGLLKALSDAIEKIAVDTQVSKEKDDKRGARVIDDYSHAHAPAAEDKFVVQTWEGTRLLQKKIKTLIKKVGKD